uniref:SFRICE006682.2 n=1 Tax=Spodoptera frugiperda TaxID=7108 RepID=A0A2H1WIH2_SPOFR
MVESIVEQCYVNRTRRFTNTCPGQALMHCLVDQMIDFCPINSLRNDDSCSVVTSISGMKYMFSQSRYMDLEKNLPRERRPTWFLKNYFDKSCCDLPVIFNTTVLEECGFSSVINYIDHGVKRPYSPPEATTMPEATTPVPMDNGNGLKIVDLNTIQDNSRSGIMDPMECCDMEDFIKSSWKSECDFHLQWTGKERLSISQPPATEPPTTTTEKTDALHDIMLVPQSCAQETCVFRNLGIIKGTEIDKNAFMDMLNNFTGSHQAWIGPTEKVVTRCLNANNLEHRSDCLINDVLACTLDVLTEHCPYKRKSGICK